MFLWPHIHDMNDVYRMIGSAVVGYFFGKVKDWFKHSFWVGFKAGLSEQIRLGRQLTPEESAALKQKVNSQLTSEFSKKLLKVAEAADSE